MGDAIFNDGPPFDERRPALYRSRKLPRRGMAAQLLDGPIVAGPLSWSSISVSHGEESPSLHSVLPLRGSSLVRPILAVGIFKERSSDSTKLYSNIVDLDAN